MQNKNKKKHQIVYDWNLLIGEAQVKIYNYNFLMYIIFFFKVFMYLTLIWDYFHWLGTMGIFVNIYLQPESHLKCPKL